MRRWLVVFLAAAAAVLSFDALRSQALASGAVHHDALAALWALVVDATVAAGILGIQARRRDRRAWAMFLTGTAASVGFQVVTPWTWAARAVPPVALFLAIVVLDLSRPTVPDETDEPVVPLGPEPVPATVPPTVPTTVPTTVPQSGTVGVPVGDPEPARSAARRPARSGLSKAERQRVRRRHGKLPASRIAEETGLKPAFVRAYVAELDQAGTPSGNGSGTQGGTP